MEITICFLIACSTGLVLLYYYFHNRERRIERYLIRHKKEFFFLLQLCYFVLTLSLIFNVRFIIYETVGKKLMEAGQMQMPPLKY